MTVLAAVAAGRKNEAAIKNLTRVINVSENEKALHLTENERAAATLTNVGVNDPKEAEMTITTITKGHHELLNTLRQEHRSIILTVSNL